MCYPAKCKRCGKTTWAGCGLHIDMVMSKVPPEERCSCGRTPIIYSAAVDSPQPAGSSCHVHELHNKAEMTSEMVKASREGKIVVIDFWSTSCAPCALMAPKFEALSQIYSSSKAAFFKVNGAEAADCCEVANISAYPTFQVWKDGDCITEVVGVDEAGLRAAVEKALFSSALSTKPS